jgi:hypothetical protein
MLHPIKVPRCAPALEWLVQLQQDILIQLCDPATTIELVIPAWIAAIRPDYSMWLEKFARRFHNKKSLLASMRTIAAASTAQKQAILRHFGTSQLFAEAFDVTVATPTMLSSLDSLGRDRIALALRHLLEAFYEIALYEGLPISAQGSAGQSFNRSQFVEMFKQENYGRVCPFCDGDMNGPQVDHWLPKSKYPALSCHPKNLVPICYRCNALEKGGKIPLDIANPRPFDNWFHPYERAAHGNFTIVVDGAHVSLTNSDLVQQNRLNNFDQLIKLTQRWWEEYRSQKNNYLSQLRGRIRKGRSKPTAEDVLETVQSWLEDIAAERTLMPHSIMRRVVLERVQTTESPDFDGWLKHAEDALS